MEVVLDGEKDKENVGSDINPCFIIVDTSLEAIEKKAWVLLGFKGKRKRLLEMFIRKQNLSFLRMKKIELIDFLSRSQSWE